MPASVSGRELTGNYGSIGLENDFSVRAADGKLTDAETPAVTTVGNKSCGSAQRLAWTGTGTGDNDGLRLSTSTAEG